MAVAAVMAAFSFQETLNCNVENDLFISSLKLFRLHYPGLFGLCPTSPVAHDLNPVVERRNLALSYERFR